jgi:hypothetical protein
MFFEMSVERRDEFNGKIRNTNRAGMLSKLAIIYQNTYS